MIAITELKEEDMDSAGVAFSSFFKEGGIRGKFDCDYCVEYWKSAIRSGASVSFLAKDRDRMAGVCMGILAPDMLTGQMCAFECIWYVQPEYKGTGIKMYRQWERACKQRGATRFIVGHLSNWSCTDMKKLYEKLGYSPHETTYVKDIENN